MTATDTETGSDTRATDRCRDAHLRHCHGTWVVHVDGTEECLGVVCEDPAECHEHRVSCAELGCHGG
ncbi:hypothetical protein [Georgenia alba]|uniref:SRCR domain-containing protein n=1 Tax=Georgenia alba TaxID=2233858 RepID=A0ABW2Q811_9MICO